MNDILKYAGVTVTVCVLALCAFVAGLRVGNRANPPAVPHSNEAAPPPFGGNGIAPQRRPALVPPPTFFPARGPQPLSPAPPHRFSPPAPQPAFPSGAAPLSADEQEAFYMAKAKTGLSEYQIYQMGTHVRDRAHVTMKQALTGISELGGFTAGGASPQQIEDMTVNLIARYGPP